MKLKNSLIRAAMLLSCIAGASPAFARVGIEIVVPVAPVVVAPAQEPAPFAVVAVPFFFGGFWWWNDGGYWHRSYSNHGPWGHPYRGRVPNGVIRYHHEHFVNHGGHGYGGRHDGSHEYHGDHRHR